MDQRLQLAERLKGLRTDLQAHPEKTVKELPKELQERVRSHKILQPITSGGLERAVKIVERINLAIFYLSDPDFPTKESPKPTPSPTLQTIDPTPVVKPTQTKPEPPKLKPVEDSSPFDFGPFDPSKGLK